MPALSKQKSKKRDLKKFLEDNQQENKKVENKFVEPDGKKRKINENFKESKRQRLPFG
jgi:hypothetical protein